MAATIAVPLTKRRLAPSAVDVWVVGLDEGRIASSDDADALRAARYINLCDRRRFAAAHGALCAIAAEYGCDHVEAHANARPLASRSGVELSLAHADDVAVVAVAGARVGVDVEHAELPADELNGMATFTLSARERAAWLVAPDRALAFQRSWARKEAVLKLLGRGIAEVALPEIEVTAGHERPALLNPHPLGVGHAGLVDLDPAPGFVGAVAVALDTPQLELRHWPQDAAA